MNMAKISRQKYGDKHGDDIFCIEEFMSPNQCAKLVTSFDWLGT
jgi:hypothetical protein